MTDAQTVQGAIATLTAAGWQAAAADPDGVPQLTGITDAAPGIIFGVPFGSAVRAYPTAAGQATVYSTASPARLARADWLAGNAAILANSNAMWQPWAAGLVSADMMLAAVMAASAVAIVVTSGTWTLEVVRGAR